MKDGVCLRRAVNLIDEIDFEDYGERHAFNDIYETLLRELQSAGKQGEYYTPRALTAFITSKVAPKLGERIADFACGTGGFLVDAIKYLRLQVKTTEDNAILQNSIIGIEKKQLPYMLCTTNLLLNDISDPQIIHGNSLERNVREYRDDEKVSVVLMNPPYGGNEQSSILNNFPADLRDSETADLFMIEILYRLKREGRVGIILPDGFLFGTDNSKVAIKKKLLEECNLHTVVRLCGSVFTPYTSIATNLLFFDKTGPTKETWFYRFDLPEGYKAFSKTKPLTLEHMKVIDEWWDNRVEIKDEKEDESLTDTYKSKKYTINEIISNGYNLDLCGFPHKEEIILEPEELIQNYEQERTKLNKAIDDKLAVIMQMLREG
ncbi:HsdM family class I SAM-dependent methyltransferase [Sporolactobacillus sp. KGMB 08714]|uniref:HsdM family class I SAM-dependent methyltransferase n=1 Tax=Sporolactobacillus sp. KGMB 08714 TaxID=3064704 RepID=UPI002FBF19D3